MGECQVTTGSRHAGRSADGNIEEHCTLGASSRQQGKAYMESVEHIDGGENMTKKFTPCVLVVNLRPYSLSIDIRPDVLLFLFLLDLWKATTQCTLLPLIDGIV